MKNLLVISGFCFVSIVPLLAKRPELVIKPFVKVQLWNSFKGEDASIFIRRGRMGLSSKVSDTWTMSTALEFDKTGKDDWAYPEGISTDFKVQLWDIYMSWKPLKDKNAFVLTTGYTLPQLSREVMTKPWFISSLEKSKSTTVLRNFVTGKNSGISPMMNAGGILGQDKLWFEYNLSWIQAGVLSEDIYSKANLVAGRLNVGLGSKQPYRYKKMALMSTKRSFLVGLNASYQGKTQTFDTNRSGGLDLVGNIDAFKFSADFSYLYRSLDHKHVNGQTGFYRMSYNKQLKENRSIEPSLTFSATNFKKNELDLVAGLSSSVDLGINYYCYRKVVKASFHYTLCGNHSELDIKATDYTTEAVLIALQFIFK